MGLEVAPLPWPESALTPVISAANVRAHRVLEERYVRRVRDLATGRYAAVLEDEGLPALIEAANAAGDRELFNNAAQAFNHQFYWRSLRPPRTFRGPVGKLRSLIVQRHANVSASITAAVRVAGRLFGSGWLWLVLDGNGLPVWRATPNATIPGHRMPTKPDRPLLTIDLWEHAYYPDFRPKTPVGPTARQRYVRSVLEQLVNWEFAEVNLDAAFG